MINANTIYRIMTIQYISRYCDNTIIDVISAKHNCPTCLIARLHDPRAAYLRTDMALGEQGAGEHSNFLKGKSSQKEREREKKISYMESNALFEKHIFSQ